MSRNMMRSGDVEKSESRQVIEPLSERKTALDAVGNAQIDQQQRNPRAIARNS